jgi:hypothetical protein
MLLYAPTAQLDRPIPADAGIGSALIAVRWDDNSDMSEARRSLARAVGVCGLLVGIYYLAPVEPDASGTQLVARTILAVAATAVLVLLIGRLVVRTVQVQPGTRPASLLVALFGGVVLFAFIDYLIAVSRPGQFVDLRTKTDAFYFAVATLATVGYGDVYASGQLARTVVTGQQLFNLAVLATGGTVLVNRLLARRPPRPDRSAPG